MKKLVVLSGAGISVESGVKTFRDAGGLWEGHDIMEVATPQGFAKNPALVLDFYNQRRRQMKTVFPNEAHLGLVTLEQKFDVKIITQNVDDLHERAGSGSILHLHGKLDEARSSKYENLIYKLDGKDILIGDTCEKGFQLRPNIVWFGEDVPNIILASKLVEQADILLIIGTSMQVYPAAGLVDFASSNCKIYVINPDGNTINQTSVTYINKKATEGIKEFINLVDHQ